MARKKTQQKIARWAGFDLSTTGLGLGVRSRDGEESCVQLKIRGATKWKDEPAFDLSRLPGMVETLLKQLQDQGWTFRQTMVSFAVRQHDMAVLDRQGNLLMPALSWQCNAASEEVARLRKLGAEDVVGRIEERFILPKLMWVLRREPTLKKKIDQVMTTGDWIAQVLTGESRLSTSDAVSNALLVQADKSLATATLKSGKLSPRWFPEVIQSGEVVGTIQPVDPKGVDSKWAKVTEILAGSSVVAGLGDNHATGVGCGLEERDFRTIVVSAGTSGTINRVCNDKVSLAGDAACFEYYRNRLLLMMLADCCKWYDRFVSKFAAKYANKMGELNTLASKADLSRVRRVLHADGKEVCPPEWNKMTLGEKVASTQFSIMLELLRLVKAMQAEVLDSDAPVARFVLTGGLSQSKFFQQVFTAGVALLAPKAKVLISARKGPMRYQTAVYGALLNAMRPKSAAAAKKLSANTDCARPTASMLKQLGYLLQASGL